MTTTPATPRERSERQQAAADMREAAVKAIVDYYGGGTIAADLIRALPLPPDDLKDAQDSRDATRWRKLVAADTLAALHAISRDGTAGLAQWIDAALNNGSGNHGK